MVTILLIYKVQKFNNIYPILSDFNEIPILINVRQKLKKNAQYIFYLHISISWKRGGSALNIFSIFYTHHRIPNKHMTINFDTITNNYEVIYVIKTVEILFKKNIYASFHQRLPNMVQRLFANVIHDAIWFMNIHEQNHP